MEEYEQPCESCGDENATLAPCPYAEEIRGDDTPVWLCGNCRHERSQDI